jgi:DNA-binding TFAR19-related protein (PDSD5 family)
MALEKIFNLLEKVQKDIEEVKIDEKNDLKQQIEQKLKGIKQMMSVYHKTEDEYYLEVLDKLSKKQTFSKEFDVYFTKDIACNIRNRIQKDLQIDVCSFLYTTSLCIYLKK